MSAKPTANSTQARWWLAGIAGCGVLLYLLGPILMPFVIGAGLAYLGDPLVDRLQEWKLSRTGGVVVVFVSLSLRWLISLIILVPMLQSQVSTLIRNIPGYLNWLQNALPGLGLPIPADMQLDAEGIKKVIAQNWSQASDLARELIGRVTRSSGSLLTFVANLLLIPVVTFYLLRDWDDLVAWIRDVIPRRWLPRVGTLASESDEVLSAFIRGQLLVMLALGTLYSIGLWIVGMDLALIVGMGAGLVSFVPYLGAIVGILVAGIAMLVQTQELISLLWVGLVFGFGQLLESTVLTPLLVGDRIGLHPVAVIFAVMAGGQLFGFVGVLLALPVAAVVAVMLRHAKARWLSSELYTRT